ncbi:MAG: C39 family peptidase [Bacilli bacterium]|nr:C39 family peptidase [Bacilli bacterium]
MDNNNLEQNNRQELENAGQNTVHAAGKAAATYFGGTIGNVAYDKLSKTKFGQGIERGVGKVIGKTPIVNQVNKGLKDFGAVNALDKAADLGAGKVGALKGGKRFNKPTTLNNSLPKTGNNPLKSSFGDTHDETPSALQNKNHNQSIRNRFPSGSYNGNEENDENENYDDYNENPTENKETLLENKQKITMLKKVLPIILPIIVIVMVLLILILLIGGIGSSISSFFSLKSHKTDDPEYSYNENQAELLKAQQTYNDAIVGSKDGRVKGIVAEYQERYGVTLDWYLINAIIMYRYTIDSENDLLSGKDDTNYEELLDSEIDAKFEELESLEEGEDNSSTEPGINYGLATWTVPWVATMMVNRNESGYYSDTKKDGEYYKYLIDSLFLKVYYKNFLKDNEYETRKKLVDDIYEYAEQAREMIEEEDNATFISKMAVVHLQTCAWTEESRYSYKEINGIKVYDNPSAGNETYSDSIEMLDYLKGVIYGEIGGHIKEEYREGLKAFTIAALTYIVRDRNSGFDLKTGEMYYPAGDCRQLCCHPILGCTYAHNGYRYGTSYVGPNRFTDYKFTRNPMSVSNSQFLDSILEEVFGYVMVKKGITTESFIGSSSIAPSAGNYLNQCSPGTCFSQEDAMNDAKNGMTYIEILNKYYSGVDSGKGFDLINIKEGLYFETDENYSGQINLNESFHYHQGDYKGSNSFCEGGTISARGCSVTSTAIAVSLLTNQKHDPLEISKLLKNSGTCNGTRYTYPISAANRYDLNSYTVSKKNTSGVNQMLADLATGNTVVVARLAANSGRYRTSSGHYIALVGVRTVDGKTQVLVWDPGSRSSSRDNYWADFNGDIQKYVNNPSYIVLSRR